MLNAVLVEMSGPGISTGKSEELVITYRVSADIGP